MNLLLSKKRFPITLRPIIISVIMVIYVVNVYSQTGKNFIVKGKEIDAKDLNRKIELMMNDLRIPAVSIAVIDRNKVVFEEAYGVKDLQQREKIDKETIFEEASVSKTFLVYVVHKLVDEGKIDLDKPMYQYLEHPALKSDPRYKQITPRMILSHSSGIENWDWMNNKDKVEILADPGTRFIYSGEGYEYLARVVETILHEPYKEYIENRIFRPFGLKRTFTCYTPDQKFPQNYAIGYSALGKPVAKSKHTETGAAGLMEGTASDYGRFLCHMFGGELSANRIKDLMKPLTWVDSSLYYGLGFEVQLLAGDTILAHGGDNPGFQSFECYSPQTQSGLVIFTSCERGRALVKELSTTILGASIVASFGSVLFEQYPNYVHGLSKVYLDKGLDSMRSAIAKIKPVLEASESDKTLFDLAEIFLQESSDIAIELLEENTKLHPASSETYWLLGTAYMSQNKYEKAYGNFVRAKKLNFSLFPFDYDLEKCREKIQPISERIN